MANPPYIRDMPPRPPPPIIEDRRTDSYLKSVYYQGSPEYHNPPPNYQAPPPYGINYMIPHSPPIQNPVLRGPPPPYQIPPHEYRPEQKQNYFSKENIESLRSNPMQPSFKPKKNSKIVDNFSNSDYAEAPPHATTNATKIEPKVVPKHQEPKPEERKVEIPKPEISQEEKEKNEKLSKYFEQICPNNEIPKYKPVAEEDPQISTLVRTLGLSEYTSAPYWSDLKSSNITSAITSPILSNLGPLQLYYNV